VRPESDAWYVAVEQYRVDEPREMLFLTTHQHTVITQHVPHVGMNRSTRDILIALVIGGGVTGGVYGVAGHPVLAGVTGLCWAGGVALALRINHLYPAYWTGKGWADRRWRGLASGTLVFAGMIGIGPLLPVTNELRYGLGILVVGAGFVTYLMGMLAVLERTDVETGATSSGPDEGQQSGDTVRGSRGAELEGP